MKYFIDTEFHEHKKPTKLLGFTISKIWTIDLISIGIVAEDGREYYAINRDLNLKYAKRNEWLKDNVIDKLPKKQSLMPRHGSPRIWQESMRWLPMEQIRQEIIAFFDDKPEFYAYYADYDWVVFCWIFGRMMDLPKGFPMYCIDLKQTLDEKANNLNSSELSKLAHLDIVKHNVYSAYDTGVLKCSKTDLLKNAINYPKQDNEHSALDDAKWNRKLYKFLNGL